MIVIAILAIPFVFYFNKTDLGASRATDLGRIYNRTITLTEFSRNARLMNLARGLGLSLGNDLMINNVPNENEMYAEFTWNRLTLLHEAEQLGIRPNSSEITAFVKTLPRFKGDDGGFDINKYTEFTTGILPSLGLDEAQIEELVSDQLILNRMKDLLSAGVHVPESETAENYERAYGKMNVSVVRFRNEDYDKDVKIADEDISKYYEAHKAELKSEEKRRVEFVTFALTPEEKKLTGKERVDPLQKVADRANDFTQALLEKGANFEEVAGKFQTPIVATGEFTAAAPDPKLAVNPQLSQYSFQLTEQSPFSDPIQGPDGFSIVHLLSVTESHPLTLEEAKPKIIETLKSERLRQLVSEKAGAAAQQIRDALKAGTPLESVARSNGLKVERLPPMSLVETPPQLPETDKEKLKKEAATDATAKDATAKDANPKDATAKDATAKDATAKDATAKDVTPKDATPQDKKAKDAKSKKPQKDEKPADEKPPEVDVAEAKPKEETPEMQSIKNAVSYLNSGDVSDFIPLEKGGGLIAVLEKRMPADKSSFATAKAQFETQILSQSQTRAFMEWLRDRRKAAGVVVGAG